MTQHDIPQPPSFYQLRLATTRTVCWWFVGSYATKSDWNIVVNRWVGGREGRDKLNRADVAT